MAKKRQEQTVEGGAAPEKPKMEVYFHECEACGKSLSSVDYLRVHGFAVMHAIRHTPRGQQQIPVVYEQKQLH